MTDSYRGVVGAVPYALFASKSWLFRSYVVVGTLAALFVAVVVTLALVVEMGRTQGVEGGLTTFSRSLFVLVGLLAVGPLLAPTLLVARRHRREDPVHDRYDPALAVSGYLFLGSLYLALVVSVPPEHQEPTGSAAITALYAVHPLFAVVPPVVTAALIAIIHRRLRG